MTKSQLIEALANTVGIARKDAELCVESVFQSMADALAEGDRIEIRGFASFKVKKYKAYKGRNPKTGKLTLVAGKKLPVFKTGRPLKERVNSESTT
jgi:integration host factor subunit beta